MKICQRGGLDLSLGNPRWARRSLGYNTEKSRGQNTLCAVGRQLARGEQGEGGRCFIPSGNTSSFPYTH